MAAQITKLQRQLDLIAFLVGRRYPVSIDQIMEGVPAYAEGWATEDGTVRESTRRKFERDKDDLKRLGIPLESVGFTVSGESDEPTSATGYLLPRKDFYLPYLRLLAEGSPEGPPPPGTPRPSFPIRERDMRWAVEALDMVQDLPDFPYRAEARSAYRKLTFDVDPSGPAGYGILQVDRPGAAEVRKRLAVLAQALTDRKRVRFAYHGIHRDETTHRDVAPWGLFLKYGNWYLVGHDATRDALRTFRIERMESLEPNTKKAQTPDYDVPGDFDLVAWADREAWELGGDAPTEAVVDFRFPRSLWAARNGHGELMGDLEDGGQRRRFRVRQTDPFLRWVLSLAGDAVIAEPPELRDALRDLAHAVAAGYGAGADGVDG